MTRKFVLSLVCICLPLVSSGASACGLHMAFNPDQLGFVGGTVARMAGLAPPEPVFDLEHPAMVKALIGETSEIAVDYARPFFSKNVRMKVTGTSNVNLQHEELLLEDRTGSVSIPYELAGSGFDFITLTITGEHKGETVTETARIYVRAKVEATDEAVQVSAR